MKGIIYTSETSANTALNKCNAIEQGVVENIGEGPFVAATTKPYTFIKKHYSQSKWAVIADSNVEEKLSKVAVELGADWDAPFLLTPKTTLAND